MQAIVSERFLWRDGRKFSIVKVKHELDGWERWFGMKRGGILLTLLLTGSFSAWAADDIMPAPKSAPRVKVQRSSIAIEEARGKRVVTGPAKLIDGERLKVGDTELRLFGVVVPLRSASRGTEAASALEKLVGSSIVTCRIQERDKGWRLLGTCSTEVHPDLSLAMLQEGWGVVARGSVQESELSDLYQAAQTKAQVQKLGMWAPAPAGSVNETPMLATATETKVAETPAGEDGKKVGDKPVEKTTRDSDAPITKGSSNDKGVADKVPVSAVSATTVTQAAAAAPEAAQLQVPTMNPPEAALAATPVIQSSTVNIPILWLLMAGMLPVVVMVLYGLGQIALRRYEYRQERKAVAAALRGELMAARAICISRADTLGYGQEAVNKLSTIWPRLRSTIFQAYVGRIGLLGPDMARRVSSLYGQFSDYAQFYAARPNAEVAGRIDNAAIQQTLFTIIDHIEDTLNNLQNVETTGRAPQKLLPPRPSATTARMQRLVETPPRREKLEFVEAELVEDEMARGDLQPQLSTLMPAPEKPATQGKAPSEAKAKESFNPTEAAPIIATVIQKTSKTSMTAETLASITATHDALKRENDVTINTSEVEEKAETENVISPSSKTVDKTVASATVPTSEAGVFVNRNKGSARRRARLEAKMKEMKAAEVTEGKAPEGEFYDFRNQTVRTANK